MATDIIARGMAASGVHVGTDGKIPADLLPSYVDDIEDLIAVSSTAPAQCSEGDKYYNTTTKLIYTATGTNTWGTDGETPADGKIYIDSSATPSKSYRWSGSDLTLVSTVIENLVDGTGTQSLKQISANVASGSYSAAFGSSTKATGPNSFAEGYDSMASGSGSHAEGSGNTASGMASHAEGFVTTASGYGSHAEGTGGTIASGAHSHAEGKGTKAAGDSQHTQGKWNIQDNSDTYAHIVGNGTADNARSNAHTLDWLGNAWFAGDVYTGSTSGVNKDAGSKKLATEEYVNNLIPQKATLPTAASTNEGVIYQYTGATDANYTNGYFYKCVSDGATPTPTYTWERIDVQPGSADLYVLDHTQYQNNTVYLKGLKKGIYCWNDAGYFFTFKWDEETDQHPMLSNIPTVNGCFIVLVDINEDIANNTTIVLCGETGTTETGAIYANTKNNFKIKKINNQYKLNPSLIPISRDVSAEDIAQTIYGVKTFETLPESRIQPTTANQLVNKSYVDSTITASLGDLPIYVIDTYTVELEGLKKGIYYSTALTNNFNFKLNSSSTSSTSVSPVVNAMFIVPNDITGEEANFTELAYLIGEAYHASFSFGLVTVKKSTASSSGVATSQKNGISYVGVYDSQTISGTKTFSSMPKVSDATTVVPTNDADFATKKYVDDNAGGGTSNVVYLGLASQYNSDANALDIGSLDTNCLYIIDPYDNTSPIPNNNVGTATMKLKANVAGTDKIIEINLNRPYNNYNSLVRKTNAYNFVYLTKIADIPTTIGTNTEIARVNTRCYRSENPSVDISSGEAICLQRIYVSTTGELTSDQVNFEYNSGNYVTTTALVQTIQGKKNFSVLPESSVTPTSDNQLVNKKYVDGSILVKTYELSGLSAYSSTSTYAVDDYVYYNNLIYKCNTAVTVAEPFDSQKWTQKTYIEYMTDIIIGSALTQSY